MKDRFELFEKMANGLLSYAVDSFFGSNVKGADKQGNFLLLVVLVIALAVLIILLYAGAEVVFLLTRTNFGTKGVKKVRAVLGSLTFLGLAYFCYRCYKNYYGQIMDFGTDLSFLYAAITFLFIGGVVLMKGLTVGGKDDTDVLHPIYRGDSWLLGGLVKDGIKQSTIQDIAEPVLFLATGFFLFSYNYIWGIPFMFCAISCWFHLTVEIVAGFLKDRKDLSNDGLVYTQNRRVTKVMS